MQAKNFNPSHEPDSKILARGKYFPRNKKGTTELLRNAQKGLKKANASAASVKMSKHPFYPRKKIA